MIFTKRGTGYEIRVRRDVGPVLAPRVGPGASAHVPHDAAHLFAEIEDGLRGGVFGRLEDANGRDGLFWPDDPAERRKAMRIKRAPTPSQSADMARSEHLASLTYALWEVDRGHRAPDASWPGRAEDARVSADLLRRLYARYDTFSAQWRRLPNGAAITVEWPDVRAPRTRRSPARGARAGLSGGSRS